MQSHVQIKIGLPADMNTHCIAVKLGIVQKQGPKDILVHEQYLRLAQSTSLHTLGSNCAAWRPFDVADNSKQKTSGP